MFDGSDNPNRTVVFFYTPLECKELKKNEKNEVPDAMVATSNAIPGLYVYDDIITEEEEVQMLKEIDANSWTKLLNRRV